MSHEVARKISPLPPSSLRLLALPLLVVWGVCLALLILQCGISVVHVFLHAVQYIQSVVDAMLMSSCLSWNYRCVCLACRTSCSCASSFLHISSSVSSELSLSPPTRTCLWVPRCIADVADDDQCICMRFFLSPCVSTTGSVG